mgnify:CR=1 FL=1
MLDIGFNRRDFLRIGGVGAGMSALGLSDHALSQDGASAYKDKTVVWLWLGGGPSLLVLIGKSFPNIRAS